MGLFSSSSDENESERRNEVDLCREITNDEKTLFSSEGTVGERKVVVTPTVIIVRVNNSGGVFPIQTCTVEFGQSNGSYRVTVSSDGVGYGLRLDKSAFREFWRTVSSVRREDQFVDEW